MSASASGTSSAWRSRSRKLSPLGEVKSACSSATASASLNTSCISSPASSPVATSPAMWRPPCSAPCQASRVFNCRGRPRRNIRGPTQPSPPCSACLLSFLLCALLGGQFRTRPRVAALLGSKAYPPRPRLASNLGLPWAGPGSGGPWGARCGSRVPGLRPWPFLSAWLDGPAAAS